MATSTSNTNKAVNKYDIYAQRDVEREVIDWSKEASNITQTITDFNTQRKKNYTDAVTLIEQTEESLGGIEQGQTQTIADTIIDVGAQTKTVAYNAAKKYRKGEISFSDYKKLLTRMDNSVKDLSATITIGNDVAKKAAENQEVSSGLGDYYSDQFLGIDDPNWSITLSENGNIYWVKYDYVKNSKILTDVDAKNALCKDVVDKQNCQPSVNDIFAWKKENGKETAPDRKTNPTSYQTSTERLGSAAYNDSGKIDLAAELYPFTKNLGVVTTAILVNSGGNQSYKTIEEIPELENAIVSQTALYGNTGKGAEILFSLGEDYQYAATVEEYKEKYGDEADIKKWLQVKNSNDPGRATGVLTKIQKERLKKEIGSIIKSQLSTDEKLTRAFAAVTYKSSGAEREKTASNTQDLRDMITTLSDVYSGDESTDSLNRLVTRANKDKKPADDKIRSIIITDEEINVTKIDKNGNVIPTSPIKRNITGKDGELKSTLNEDEIISLSNLLGLSLDKDIIDKIVKTNEELNIGYSKRAGKISGKRGENKLIPGGIDLIFKDMPDVTWSEDPSNKIGEQLAKTYFGAAPNLEIIRKNIEAVLPRVLGQQNVDGETKPINIVKQLNAEGLSGNLTIKADDSDSKFKAKIIPITQAQAKELLIEEGEENPTSIQIKNKVSKENKELKESKGAGTINLELAGVKKKIRIRKGRTADDIKKELQEFINEVYNALNKRRFGTTIYDSINENLPLVDYSTK